MSEQTMKVQLNLKSLELSQMTGFDAPEDATLQTAWLLYRGMFSEGITGVIDKACEVYPEEIDSRTFRFVLLNVCRELVIDYLESIEDDA